MPSAPCSVIHSSTSARALARVMADSAARRWRSQPKPSSVVGPFVRRRLDLERRAAVADHDLAGEGEAAGIDFARAGRVGGAQVLRRDQQPVGVAGARSASAAADGALSRPRPMRNARRADERGQPGASATETARHRRARPSAGAGRSRVATGVTDSARAPPTANSWANARTSQRVSEPRGVEAVEPAHARIGIGQMAGQRAQIARRR